MAFEARSGFRSSLLVLILVSAVCIACSDPAAPVGPAQLELEVRNGLVLDVDGEAARGVHLQAVLVGVDHDATQRAVDAIRSLEVRLPDGSSVELPPELERWNGFRSGLFIETGGPAPVGDYELTARFRNGSRVHVVRGHAGAEIIDPPSFTEVRWEEENASMTVTLPPGTLLWALHLNRLDGTEMERVATGLKNSYPAPVVAAVQSSLTYGVDRDPTATYAFAVEVLGVDSYRRDAAVVPDT